MADNPYGLKKVKQKVENKSGSRRPKGKKSKFSIDQSNKLKIRKLKKINKRGRVTGNKKKLGNLNRKDALRPENMKGRGMSGLGADYGKQEKKLQKKVDKHRKSKTYKENIAKHNESLKSKNNKSTTKRTDSKTTGGNTGGGSSTKRTPSGKGVRDKFVRYKGKFYRRGTAQAKKAEKAEAARKRLAAKGYMRR